MNSPLIAKKILLVGCGQLGSRHLQAVSTFRDIQEIHILDIDKNSHALGKSRLQEMKERNTAIRYQWFEDMPKESKRGDICIVATQARGRCELIKRIANELHYKKFLIEKIVTQSIEEYEDLISFCDKRDLKVWVNCKTRAYAIHQYFKSKLDPSEPFVMSACGGNHGLANNGVHAADLFVFYDGTNEIKSAGSRIDPFLHPSKRGEDLFDLSGTLLGVSAKGSEFILSYQKDEIVPDVLTVVSSRFRFTVDHMQRFAWESLAENNWQWQAVPFTENVLVSQMTKTFVMDILQKGRCALPTLKECFPAHQFILGQLQRHFNELMHVHYDYCPVT